jgi:hypothetical protein
MGLDIPDAAMGSIISGSLRTPGWWWASSKAPLDAGAGVIGGLDLKLIASSVTKAPDQKRARVKAMNIPNRFRLLHLVVGQSLKKMQHETGVFQQSISG